MRPFLLAALIFLPRAADAKAQGELAYRIDEAFSTAMRYVRVDRGCKITDKDPDAAFIMFECPLDGQKISRGGIEIFRAQTKGRESVRLSVTMADESHGVELRVLELIERKLREERGTPPKPAPSPDLGAK